MGWVPLSFRDSKAHVPGHLGQLVTLLSEPWFLRKVKESDEGPEGPLHFLHYNLGPPTPNNHTSLAPSPGDCRPAPPGERPLCMCDIRKTFHRQPTGRGH